MFETILVSVLSIKPTIFEYLKTPSNWFKVLVLYPDKVVITFDLIVSEVFVVASALNFTLEVKSIVVVSGSTNSGLTDTTLNFLSCAFILSFVELVKVEPDIGLIAILTTPYCGVSSSSPPHALTDWAFA